MGDLVRTEANSLSNPRVVFGWQPSVVQDSSNSALKAGFFQPLDSMTYRVLRPDATELIAATVVDPTLAANQLDAAADIPGRLIVPPFTIAANEPTGDYTIEVTFVAHPTGADALDPQTVSWTFRLLDEQLGHSDAYAQVTDLLTQGFPLGQPAPCPGGFTFTQGAAALVRASRFIEDITGRIFEPRYMVLDVDGQGGPFLQFAHAIAGLTDVRLTYTTFSPADLPLQEGDIRVYNRHLRQRLVGRGEDDRQDPRIEFLRVPSYGSASSQLTGEADLLSGHTNFVQSTQNIQVAGVWGYSEYDGSPFGAVPLMIQEVTMRLAARYLEPLWTQLGGAGVGHSAAGPITVERTLDQSVSYANLSSSMGAGAYAGAFTGDPEIDQILAMYKAPPVYRSA